ncbi:MAG: GNAT family N-acetyltransferase [Bacteroidota bacterium]
MVVKKDQMLIIGDVGFKGRPGVTRQVDIGYGIVASERKRGYAFEATKGLINWAFLSDKVDYITAKSLILNIDSIQILKKLSFSEVSRDMEMISWSLAKPGLN